MIEPTMNDITFKQITLAEADLVVNLFNQYRIFYKQFSDIGMAKAFIEARLQHNESIIFIAINANGTPVGFTQLYPTYSSARMTKNWILNDLFVDADHRKLGIGEGLIKTAMKFAKTQGATFLQLETSFDNFTAQSLYETIGFKKQEENKEFLLYKISINE
jgi:ribosomal protein S18 acetylase RimI-like enzyme